MRPIRILIFAKAPQAGFAKTRLIPALGAQGAAGLARQMLFNTVQVALDAGVDAVELCVTPDVDNMAWQDIALPQGVEIFNQREGDLGARLARAAKRALASASILLIGTDCVDLSGGLLREAAHQLNKHEAMVHCTADGGYAVLGLNQFNPYLFSDMPWSTDAVADITMARIRQFGWSLHVGRTLHDVDEPQDLKHVPASWGIASGGVA